MAFIVIACGVLGGDGGGIGRFERGGLLIALACMFWALDNNLTRKIAANDAMLVAAAKGSPAAPSIFSGGVLAGPAPPPGRRSPPASSDSSVTV